MNPEHNEPSSRDYEREAEATRHRLARGLAELNDRLTPGQVFDEVLTYAKDGSGNFLRSLGNAARANPIPSLLIGAGCMMFLSEKMGIGFHGSNGHNGHARPRNPDRFYDGSAMGRQYETGGAAEGYARQSLHDIKDRAGSGMRGAADYATSGVRGATDFVSAGMRGAAEVASSGVSSAAEGVRGAAGFVGDQASNLAGGVQQGASAVGDTLSGAVQKARETAHDLRDQVAGAAGQVRQSAQSVGETVQGYTSAIGDQASRTADRTRQYASQAGQQVTDRATALVNDQPLLVAAIGLAVGAAIAACLPATRTEDEMMGEASDAVKKAARDVASEQFATAKAVAGRVAEEAKTVAEREGLTTRVVADAAQLIGDKVKKVVSETAAVGKSEIQGLTSAERPY